MRRPPATSRSLHLCPLPRQKPLHTHVPACGVPGSPRLAIRTPSKTTKTPVPSDLMVHSACCFSVMGQPSHFGGTLRQRCCETYDPFLWTMRQGPAHKVLGRLANDQAAGAFPSMSLFLVTVVVFAAGLLGTLYVLFREAQQGTKALKRSSLSNWK